MRDAIVFSSWSWDMFNVPERIALALSMRGGRVLYCEMPASRLKGSRKPLSQFDHRIYGFRPDYWGAKLNHLAPARRFQWRRVARQILEAAAAVQLKDPVFIYSHVKWIEPLCDEMRAKGFPLVHVCMDYPEPYQYPQIALSDRTLVIPKTVAHKLKAKFGDKVVLIPQSIHLPGATEQNPDSSGASSISGKVSHPRLGYLGPIHGRLNLPLLRELLTSHPEWQFYCFGGAASLGIANAHDIGWVRPEMIQSQVGSFDVGIMPYDCFEDKNLHCVPLKLFDYFLAGIPVVSTPLISLCEYEDLIYFGETPQEFARAISSALEEPSSSPRRRRRIEVAKLHSTEILGQRLESLLNFGGRSGI